jgi:hypothetical protein
VWATPTTSDGDRERFFGQSAATRIHVIETDWALRMTSCELWAYRFPIEPFRPHDVGGYWVASDAVDAEERTAVGSLLQRHADAEIELRITPSIIPFWERVVSSSLEFSGLRLRNARERGSGRGAGPRRGH